MPSSRPQHPWYLVNLLLAGALAAQALVLLALAVVELLGLGQQLGDAVQVLDGLQRPRHLLLGLGAQRSWAYMGRGSPSAPPAKGGGPWHLCGGWAWAALGSPHIGEQGGRPKGSRPGRVLGAGHWSCAQGGTSDPGAGKGGEGGPYLLVHPALLLAVAGDLLDEVVQLAHQLHVAQRQLVGGDAENLPEGCKGPGGARGRG